MADNQETEGKRAQRSKRYITTKALWSKGGEKLDVENPLDCEGVVYVSTDEKDTKLELWFDEVDERIKNGFAAFGALTLAGNVANTYRVANGRGQSKTVNPSYPYKTEQEALDAWVAALKNGDWTTGTGETIAGLPMLAKALVRVGKDAGRTMDEAEVLEKLRALTEDRVKDYRASPQVAAAIAAIRAEQKADAAKSATLGTDFFADIG